MYTHTPMHSEFNFFDAVLVRLAWAGVAMAYRLCESTVCAQHPLPVPMRMLSNLHHPPVSFTGTDFKVPKPFFLSSDVFSDFTHHVRVVKARWKATEITARPTCVGELIAVSKWDSAVDPTLNSRRGTNKQIIHLLVEDASASIICIDHRPGCDLKIRSGRGSRRKCETWCSLMIFEDEARATCG